MLSASPIKPIALQVKATSESGVDQYIAFNSAKGANAQNDEADDLVTIVEWQTAIGYAQSSLKGYIGQGESFNLAGNKVLTVQCINTAATPSVACVCVGENSQTCPNNCSCVVCSILSGGDCKKEPKCKFDKGNCRPI